MEENFRIHLFVADKKSIKPEMRLLQKSATAAIKLEELIYV